MPELPEVETIRLGLEPVLSGRRIVRVEQRRKDLRFPLPDRFVERLTGRRIERLERRAKYILIHLEGDEVLAVHLGMTGRLSLTARRGQAASCAALRYAQRASAKHDHLVFFISGGAVVTYNDARRFGYMTLIAGADLAHSPYLRGLGVEPLGPGLNAAYLARRAHRKKANLKALLMDQRIIAGIGNIYACEALFRAGLNPSKPAARLSTKTGAPTPLAGRLVAAIRAVLEQAICAGGSTLRDYKQADGTVGNFQSQFQIYGREGEPCLRPSCRGTVRRKTLGGRSTFYCPVCQR
jgi:formamidopyrimidine-DNA glycosylase